MFRDRRDAGRQLAERLLKFQDRHPVILALPRGGVPVGFEVARALEAPLDVVLVRKIGAPDQPELAIAAVVDGPQAETVINREMVEMLGINEGYIQQERARQLAEIERRRARYVADRPRPEIAGQTAILVDDGIATGATARAALHAIRRALPGRLILAVPVAPPDAIESLRADADEVICLSTPAYFAAISLHYAEFAQTTDEEVVALLDQATSFGRGGVRASATGPAAKKPTADTGCPSTTIPKNPH